MWDESDRSKTPRRVGSPASLRREVEASLRRLGVDRIDLYQLHWPAEDGTPLEEYWQTFADLRAEGKIRAAGLSNHSVAQLTAAEAVAHVDSLQPQFSLIHRDAAAELIPWCAAHGTGVIVYSPMGAGLLTGAFTPERAASLDQGDWRSRSGDFTGDGLTRNLALVEGLRPVADRLGASLGAVAVAWTLAFPGVSGAIVGARSPQQVDGWLAAAELVLDDKDLAEIAAAVASSGAAWAPPAPCNRPAGPVIRRLVSPGRHYSPDHGRPGRPAASRPGRAAPWPPAPARRWPARSGSARRARRPAADGPSCPRQHPAAAPR